MKQQFNQVAPAGYHEVAFDFRAEGIVSRILLIRLN
jgi:hypothetical protein